jgi:pilus assembly protein Flp/PilA
LKLTMTIVPKVKAQPRQTIRLIPCGKETIMDLIARFISDEAGAAALEYALILALLGIGLIASIRAIGTNLSGVFTTVAGKL